MTRSPLSVLALAAARAQRRPRGEVFAVIFAARFRRCGRSIRPRGSDFTPRRHAAGAVRLSGDVDRRAAAVSQFPR